MYAQTQYFKYNNNKNSGKGSNLSLSAISTVQKTAFDILTYNVQMKVRKIQRNNLKTLGWL